MNREQFENQWVQVRAAVKDRWSNLTDEDIRQINGRYDQFVAKLQQRYNITRDEAEAQFRSWDYERAPKTTYLREDQRPTSDSTLGKWLLGAGIPLLLLAGYLAYENSKSHDQVKTAPQATVREVVVTETPGDRLISLNIRKALLDNDQITTNLDNIRIVTSNNTVTVSGFVSSNQERDVILRIVKENSGSKTVNNQLQVK